MKLTTPLRPLHLALTALVLPLFAGCEIARPAGPGTGDGPVYAITTQVSTADEPQSYVILTDKLDHTESLSLDQGIELPGRALGAGVSKSGALFVAGSDGPTITRYNLTSEGRLEKGATVSFEGKGVASIGEYQHQLQFISESKAYYFDGRTSQLIVWNPSDMSLTGSIPLNGVSVQGAIQTFATLPIRLENQVIMPMGWRPSTGVGITKLAGVVVVDTRTDAVTVVTDTRCGYVRDGVMGPDGMLYLATEVYGAAVRRVAGGETPEPCLLRFNPQTLTFDPSFHIKLDTLVNGGTAGSLLPGPQGTAYLRVFDERLFPVQASTHPRALASSSSWKWWKLRLDTLTATPVETLPATTGSTFLYPAGDRTIFTEFANGSTATNFRDLTDESGKVTMSLSGLSFSFLQLR
ncbi:hypothetical protein [Archangium lansingense]|uniref:MxcI protein n=1 Tax=Archangium lansingense TaxID=2995310 RepID=A0ABT4ACZ2_9BACT|nr:hypothetical protein [Archangium lansinium]MCY1079529.1 hypothetical protein [Archangium lansinium]